MDGTWIQLWWRDRTCGQHRGQGWSLLRGLPVQSTHLPIAPAIRAPSTTVIPALALTTVTLAIATTSLAFAATALSTAALALAAPTDRAGPRGRVGARLPSDQHWRLWLVARGQRVVRQSVRPESPAVLGARHARKLP